MAERKPSVAFLFPYEWLSTKEGRKYFKKNITKHIKKFSGMKPPEHARLATGLPSSFSVVITQYAYKPKRFYFKKEDMEKIFEDIYPGARLLAFETLFIQTFKEKVFCRMEIYY